MTTEQMIVQIKHQLGYPAIDVELDDKQIEICIENALTMAKDHLQTRRYKSFPVATVRDQVQPLFTSRVDLSELEFDEVTQVYRGDSLSPYLYDQFYLVNYSTRGVPATLATAINLRSNVEALINRSWKVIGKTLYLDKYYTTVTIEFIPTVISLEDVDDSFWVGWVMRYALACAKEVLSRIRGKFVVESNPYRTDADVLSTEASSEKAALLEEIKDRGLLMITR